MTALAPIIFYGSGGAHYKSPVFWIGEGDTGAADIAAAVRLVEKYLGVIVVIEKVESTKPSTVHFVGEGNGQQHESYDPFPVYCGMVYSRA